MVTLGSLWRPILVSSVVVFLASSLVWMVLPHHRSDWKALPEENGLLAAMRKAGVGRGQYRFPFVDPRDKSPKEVADGVAYGLLTAGVFGWLWPR